MKILKLTTKKSIAAIVLLFLTLVICAQTNQADNSASGIWTEKKANDWYKQQGWPIGCNFLPSTAINQLEMWEPETFDTATINRELGWAENIGFNTLRVF